MSRILYAVLDVSFLMTKWVIMGIVLTFDNFVHAIRGGRIL